MNCGKRWMILASSLLILFLVIKGETSAQDVSLMEDTSLLLDGQTLLDESNPEKAILKFRELLEGFPKSGLRDLAWYSLGLAYLETGQMEEARVALRELEAEYPKSPLAPKLSELVEKTLPPTGEETPPLETVEVSPSPEETPDTSRRLPEAVPPKTKTAKPGSDSKRAKSTSTSDEGFVFVIKQVADATVDILENSLSIYPGETGVLPFRVINRGNSEDGFRLSVNLPIDFQSVFYADRNGNGRLDGGEKRVLKTPPIGVDEAFSVLLKVQLPQSFPDGVSRSVEITVSSLFDPNFSKGARATLVTRGPQLTGEFTVSDEKVRPGEKLSYTLIISNGGTAEARDVKLQYTYHPNLVFLSGSPGPLLVEEATRTLVWGLGTLKSHGEQSIKVKFRVGEKALAGTQITTRGTLESSLESGPVSISTSIVTVQQIVAVNIDTALQDLPTTPGDLVHLPISISNLGNGNDSFTIRVEGNSHLDPRVYADFNSDGIHQSTEPKMTKTPLLGSRESFPALVQVSVPVEGIDKQRMQIRISAVSNLDQRTSFHVVRSLYYMVPKVTVSTESSVHEGAPGSVISYQITAVNSGSGVAKNLVIRDLLPEELEYVGSDPTSSQNPNGDLVWNLDELAPNQKKIFIVNVKTRADLRAGTVINKETQISYTDINGNRYE